MSESESLSFPRLSHFPHKSLVFSLSLPLSAVIISQAACLGESRGLLVLSLSIHSRGSSLYTRANLENRRVVLPFLIDEGRARDSSSLPAIHTLQRITRREVQCRAHALSFTDSRDVCICIYTETWFVILPGRKFSLAEFPTIIYTHGAAFVYERGEHGHSSR